MSLPERKNVSLLPHPGATAPRGLGVVAGVEWEGGRDTLRIRYEIAGPVRDLRLPARSAAPRRDGLWHHTCFEAFLKPDESEAYLEFIFAPSGDWAAYRFASRRNGVQAIDRMTAPEITVARATDRLEVVVRLSLAGIGDVRVAGGARLGLAAVLEDAAGRHSYWALTHTGTQPDFHDPRAFTLVLTAHQPETEPAS